MAKVIDCPCGETIRGENEDDVLDQAERHVADKHPELADQLHRGALSEMLKDD
jgi:hypothetical protein